MLVSSKIKDVFKSLLWIRKHGTVLSDCDHDVVVVTWITDSTHTHTRMRVRRTGDIPNKANGLCQRQYPGCDIVLVMNNVTLGEMDEAYKDLLTSIFINCL